MIIKIQKREDPYARIDNRVPNDTRLSYRALGLLVYLLSKPNNWQVRANDLIKDCREGRDAVRAAFRELSALGYARLANTSRGREWLIYEAPRAKDGFSGDGPCPEKANMAKSGHIETKENTGTNERPVKLAGSEFAVRIRAVMHRQERTGFSEKELKSFRKIANKVTDADLSMVERYYKRNWPPNRDRNILRHDLYTFLNNYCGEVDRALQWCEKHPFKTRTVRFTEAPEKPVEIPVDPVAFDKFITSFEQQFNRLPFGYERNSEGAVVRIAANNGAQAA